LFPADVAATLAAALPRGAGDLASLSPGDLADLLRKAGHPRPVVAEQERRFARLRQQLQRGGRLDALPGFSLDLPDGALSAEDLAGLRVASIDSLDDWAERRERAHVSDGGRRVLDTARRLTGTQVPPERIPALAAAGISGSFDLAFSSKGRRQELARRLGVAPAEVEQWARQARRSMAGATVTAANTLLYGSGPVAPSWMTGADCRCCPEDWSIFSRFAYFGELVRITGDSLATLDARLHQGLGALDLTTGLAPTSQVAICAAVLSRAFPTPLSYAEDLPRRWHLLRSAVPFTAASPAELASDAAAAVATLDAASLGTRFALHLGLPEAPPASVFTAQELDALSTAAADRGLVEIRTTVGREPEFRLAPGSVINQEGQRRLDASLLPARREAAVLQRDAYKERTGQRDDQLFDQLLIDMDQAACETITPVDQAIRSLQALLDRRRAAAPTGEEQARWRYDSFAAWRANRLAAVFPEFGAFARDDVITGESGAADRGSIIRDAAEVKPRLRQALGDVRQALSHARIDTGRNYRNAPEFKGTSQHAHFERGLEALDLILDADDHHALACRHLDDDQPGLAIAKLGDSLRSLERLADLVFRPEARFRDPAAASFDALLRLAAGERNTRLKVLGGELLLEPKALYEVDPDLAPIAGLDVDSGAFTDLARWQHGSAFRLATPADGPERAGRIIKSVVGSSDITAREAVYIDGQSLGDYKLKCRVDLRDADALHSYSEREMFGILARADGSSRFRLAVISEWVTKQSAVPEDDIEVDVGNEDANNILNGIIDVGQQLLGDRDDSAGSSYSVMEGFLVLQRVDDDGRVTEIDRAATGFGWATGAWNFTLEVEGRSVKGVLKFGGTGRREVSVSAASRPPGDHGSFGVFASGSVEADFGPLFIEAIRQGENDYPPFYASRRASPEKRHAIDTNDRYPAHVHHGAPLSVKVDPAELFRTADGVDAQALASIRRDGDPVNLLFDDRQPVVALNALDRLLDRLLARSFYLRYAAIPVRLAQAYARTGDYAAAVRILKIVYDDDPATESDRAVCPFLTAAPLALGPTAGRDSRLLRLRLAEIYLAWAEWLFRRNSAEERYQAELLLKRVLDLHEQPAHCGCDAPYREAPARLTRFIARVLRPGAVDVEMQAALDRAVERVLLALARAREACVARARVVQILNALTGIVPASASQALARLRQAAADLEAAAAPPAVSFARFGPLELAEELRNIVDLTALAPLGPGLQYGDAITTPGADGAIAMWVLGFHVAGLCTPANPLVSRQLQRACVLLDHLAHCRNILGFEADTVPERRFAVLVQLAQRFTDLALGAEKDLLSFRQAFEAESFSLLQATNQLAAAEATVEIERLKADNALGEVGLAGLQLGQAQFTVSHYETLIANGLSDWEEVALTAAWTSAGLSSLAVLPAIASMVLAGAGVATAATGIGAVPGAVMTTIGAAGTLLSAVTGGIQGAASAAGAVSNAAAMTASFERREEEWQYQLGLGRFNAAIAEAGLGQALGRHAIAVAEQGLAELNRRAAVDAVQFLSNKFLNREMWAFMQRVMREEYRTRLNYAIGAAFMAERALAFELQSSVNVVRFDYFDPRRDGLLGATQLATDLARLEGTRLSQERRKLQVTKNLSLASLMPADFQRFRDGNGRLPFRTLMAWLDRDFPGQYMRLIQSVRLTVIALVPPFEGIHATLSSSGISQVVVGPPFETRTVRANPETVAFSSAYQASGVFQLDYRGEFRLPFEGTGFETDWVLELPRAGNPFDFQTIADVVMTVEYTALVDAGYRRRVQLELGNQVSGERALSVPFNFPDLWYQLHNPEAYAAPLTLSLATRVADFPANVSDPRIDHVMLYVVPRAGSSVEISGVTLSLGTGAGPVSASADTANGIISTRRPSVGSTHPWDVFKTRPAVGPWTLTLPDSATLRARFTQGEIVDLVFVVSFTGTVPGWPA
jgi:tetratricopeptide (TPR) repeat protein